MRVSVIVILTLFDGQVVFKINESVIKIFILNTPRHIASNHKNPHVRKTKSATKNCAFLFSRLQEWPQQVKFRPKTPLKPRFSSI